jgi:hypothetical protein
MGEVGGGGYRYVNLLYVPLGEGGGGGRGTYRAIKTLIVINKGRPLYKTGRLLSRKSIF